jgi:ABC-type multidrug transport system ATPase subunit
MLDRVLTLRENLQLFASLYGAPKSRCEELVSRLGASAFADTPVAELSRGQEQAAALGRALVHKPSVILLDEPFNALDPEARKRLLAVLKEEAALGATVLFSTHDVESASGIASRVVKLAQGRIA